MPSPRALRAAALFALLALAAQPSRAVCGDFGLPDGSEIVEIETDMGTLCVELLREEAPITVENFVGYVERGDYDGSFLHLAVPGRSVQGGGFALDAEQKLVEVPELDPIANESCDADAFVLAPNGQPIQVCSQRGNVRGTLAMAKIDDEPDSATNQWFINLADNRANLDNQNQGFTVFARVLGDGMTVADAITSDLPRGTPEQIYWLSPLFVRSRPGAFDAVPLESEVPLQTAAPDVGCFDPTRLAVVQDPQQGFQAVQDPLTGDFFFVSAGCVTQIPLDTFQPAPGTPSCPDPSQRAEAVNAAMNVVSMSNPCGRPFFADFDGDLEADQFSVSCEEKQEALTSREAWRADFRARLAPELVEIRQARLIQVPEPAVAALATLVALRLARRRA